LLVIYLFAVASAAGDSLPAANAFRLSFQTAITCATDAATQASFARDQIDHVPQEALEHCTIEKERAIQDMAKAIQNSDPNLARDNVSAKMRMTAQEHLIKRLETGEAVFATNEDGYGLQEAAVRKISCVRLAINHMLEGVYFGRDWTSEIGGLPEDQVEGYFVNIGRSSCPKNFELYAAKLADALNAADGRTKNAIASNWSLEKIDRLTVGPYLRLASRFRHKKL
jgi:hypothetical protein